MKCLRWVLFLSLFLSIHPWSLALMSVGVISPERAKEQGIELRARPGGPDHAWIELEFKPEGLFADFSHVSIEVSDGENLELSWTPLKDVRTRRGTVIVRVMGSRTFLERVTLRIVHGDFGRVGEDLHLNQFVDFENLKRPDSANESENAATDAMATSVAVPAVDFLAQVE